MPLPLVIGGQQNRRGRAPEPVGSVWAERDHALDRLDRRTAAGGDPSLDARRHLDDALSVVRARIST